METSYNQRVLFLDRDGVINIDYGYVGARDSFKFRDGVVQFLRAARDDGWRLVVVTNQSGVGRGYYTEADYNDVTSFMREQLMQFGIGIDLVFACFTHLSAENQAFKRESYWRKPNPGMICDGIQRLAAKVSESVMIGDSIRDIEAGFAAGIPHCLLLEDTETDKKLPPRAHRISTFEEAYQFLCKLLP